VSGSSLTAATLTHWLRRGGGLRGGAVADIRVEREVETSISTLTFLTATYTADVPADMPRRLVVKSPLVPAKTRGDSSGEAHFYRTVAPLLGAPPLVRCLAALDEGDGDRETVILEDLRATHDHPPWPLPPSRAQCQLALDALVRVHAHWWEAPTLGHTVGQFHTSESLTSMVHGIAAHLPAFIDAVGDALTAGGRRVLERVFASSLRPWLRLTDRRALTVAHGDAHSWNFLFPRSGDGPAFLIDWQLWHLDLGARDLAFFMALHWYPSRRRELEGPLLEYYHQGLLARDLATYALDELWLDYRRCVVRNLTIPILFWRRGMQPQGWWHRLECALAAYHDLGCDELL
jgi:hypothetical protein